MPKLLYTLIESMTDGPEYYQQIASTADGRKALGLKRGEVGCPVVLIYRDGTTHILTPNEERDGFSSISGSPGSKTVEQVVHQIKTMMDYEKSRGRLTSDPRAIIDSGYGQLKEVANALELEPTKVKLSSLTAEASC